MMRCPNCNSIDLGKIADNQFYCWHCFIEIADINGKLEIYQVESDGTLTAINDLIDGQNKDACQIQ